MKIYYQVPDHQLEQFLAQGWQKSYGTLLHFTEVRSVVPNDPLMLLLNEIPLIQHGNIKRPFVRFAGKSIGSAVALKYQPEILKQAGILSQSLQVLEALSFVCVTRSVPEITRTVNELACTLRTYSFLPDAEHARYVEYLVKAFTEDPDQDMFERAFDFWWDIKNHVMFSFDRHFLSRVPEHIKTSVDKL